VRPEFIIERQGRTFVSYAGLLAEAHERGLESIATELLQFPSEANGQTTIARAIVKMSYADRPPGIFSGIGDANPKNVGPGIVGATIRMAETRAKVRALRDAINVAMLTLEELDGEDQLATPTAPTPIRPAAAAAAGLAASSVGTAAAPAAAAGELYLDERALGSETAEGKARIWSALVRRAHAARVRPPAEPPAAAMARAIVNLSKAVDRAERQAPMGMSS
jgi:hypothetical protein